MFGISFTEIMVIALVALVVVGPQKLPKMLRTMGEWIGKMRSLTTQVRKQTGIDDILREEGIDGGLSELRGILRGDLSSVGRRSSRARPAVDDPYEEPIEYDRSREYPVEGPDAYGALPDDLAIWDEDDNDAAETAAAAAPASAAPGVTPSNDAATATEAASREDASDDASGEGASDPTLKVSAE